MTSSKGMRSPYIVGGKKAAHIGRAVGGSISRSAWKFLSHYSNFHEKSEAQSSTAYEVESCWRFEVGGEGAQFLSRGEGD